MMHDYIFIVTTQMGETNYFFLAKNGHRWTVRIDHFSNIYSTKTPPRHYVSYGPTIKHLTLLGFRKRAYLRKALCFLPTVATEELRSIH